jgi:hypothetical protein
MTTTDDRIAARVSMLFGEAYLRFGWLDEARRSFAEAGQSLGREQLITCGEKYLELGLIDDARSRSEGRRPGWRVVDSWAGDRLRRTVPEAESFRDRSQTLPSASACDASR